VKPIFAEASGAEPPYTRTTCPAESSPGDRRALARPARIQTRTSEPLHELHVQIEDIQEILRHFDVKVMRDSCIVIKSDSTQTALNKVNDEVFRAWRKDSVKERKAGRVGRKRDGTRLSQSVKSPHKIRVSRGSSVVEQPIRKP